MNGKNTFTLGVFVDLSKAFDTVNHEILFKKITLLWNKRDFLSWFKSCLKNRKKFITYNKNQTTMLNIVCVLTQGSILGTLLFLLYVNGLQHASTILEQIMFVDDTNLFFSHKNIMTL